MLPSGQGKARGECKTASTTHAGVCPPCLLLPFPRPGVAAYVHNFISGVCLCECGSRT